MRRSHVITVAVTLAAASLLLGLNSCATTFDRRDPTGEVFPTVTGESLAGETVTFPDVGAGEPLLLFIGYDQDAQFDIDRWLIGTDMIELGVRMFELPTIPGMFPRMFAGTIDNGMRKGIPKEDWGGVVTLYDEAEPVAKLTGNDGANARVVLLDAEGRIVFFHDRGFSVGNLRKLETAAKSLD